MPILGQPLRHRVCIVISDPVLAEKEAARIRALERYCIPTPGPYREPVWLRGGHLQTIYGALFAPRPRVRYRRERWDTPDGDFIDLDWVEQESGTGDQDSGAGNPAFGNAPLLVLFHGLEGGSESHYALALMAAVRARGWAGVVVHFRGCSGEPNRLPRAYHSGDSAEIDWVLRRLASSRPASMLYAAVSAPLDLMAAGDHLARGFNRVYTRLFLSTLKRKSLVKLRRYPNLFDRRAVARARTLREFDNHVTAPLHGFRDTDDYWTRASSRPWLTAIRVPSLLVNARNDPFLPERFLPTPREVSTALTLDFPPGGGHVGFVTGRFPGRLDWLPRRILGFFDHAADAVMRHAHSGQPRL